MNPTPTQGVVFAHCSASLNVQGVKPKAYFGRMPSYPSHPLPPTPGVSHITNLKQLKDLSLQSCVRLTNACLASVAALTGLQQLNIRGCLQVRLHIFTHSSKELSLLF